MILGLKVGRGFVKKGSIMRYLVCYRFHKKGQWYIHKDCKEDDLQTVIIEAFLVENVVEVKIEKLPMLWKKGD